MNVSPFFHVVSSPMAATGSTTGSGGTNLLTESGSIFMQLLTTQLENQSPLDPVNSSQLTQQLVELNMLDQLSQMNRTLQNAFPSSGSSASNHRSNSAVQGVY